MYCLCFLVYGGSTPGSRSCYSDIKNLLITKDEHLYNVMPFNRTALQQLFGHFWGCMLWCCCCIRLHCFIMCVWCFVIQSNNWTNYRLKRNDCTADLTPVWYSLNKTLLSFFFQIFLLQGYWIILHCTCVSVFLVKCTHSTMPVANVMITTVCQMSE